MIRTASALGQVARKGSHAKLGVVLLAPAALGLAMVGLVVGVDGRGLREHAPSRDGWMLACFAGAALLFVCWLACIVRAWMTLRADQPIPRAKTIVRPR
jgi:hypothetical protein